jgi:hypothetical protein
MLSTPAGFQSQSAKEERARKAAAPNKILGEYGKYGTPIGCG